MGGREDRTIRGQMTLEEMMENYHQGINGQKLRTIELMKVTSYKRKDPAGRNDRELSSRGKRLWELRTRELMKVPNNNNSNIKLSFCAGEEQNRSLWCTDKMSQDKRPKGQNVLRDKKTSKGDK